MRITSVSYRKLVSDSNFSHTAIEATATVGDGEDSQTVLDTLQEWVHLRLGVSPPFRNSDADRIRRLAGELEAALSDAKIPF